MTQRAMRLATWFPIRQDFAYCDRMKIEGEDEEAFDTTFEIIFGFCMGRSVRMGWRDLSNLGI